MSFKEMRKLIYLFFPLIFCLTIQAQDNEERQSLNPTAREKIRAARVGLITQRLPLTPEQAEKFWPIYNEFIKKRSELQKSYREMEKNVGKNNSDPNRQQELLNQGLKIKQDELTLEKEYSNKLLTVITPQQLLNLHKAEREFRNIIINTLNKRRSQQGKAF